MRSFPPTFCVAAVLTVLASPSLATQRIVSPDGSGPFPDILSAISASASGDTVGLLDGVFTGEGNRDLEFAGMEIVLRSCSGNPEACIVDCQGAPGYLRRFLVFQAAEEPGARVEGLTIRNGWRLFDDVDAGGGILCDFDSRPTIDRCVFLDCEAGYGGGIAVRGGASPLITNCSFRGNHAFGDFGIGGGLGCYQGAATVIGCDFTDNVAYMGGGAGAIQGALFTLEGCTIAGNIGYMLAGALYCGNSTNRLSGCTIYNNRILSSGNAIYQGSGGLEVERCIVFQNQGGAIGSAHAGISFTCTDLFANSGGDWTGYIAPQAGINGNLSADPLFCGAANPGQPYTLHALSPCAPEHNPDCGLIGAWPVGCGAGAAPVDPVPMLSLGMPVPNPLRTSTAIEYRLEPERDGVTVGIYDPAGRAVRTLTSPAAPRGTVVWDGRNERGEPVPAGLYLCRIDGGSWAGARRVLVLR